MDLPSVKKTTRCKFVFRIKYEPSGKIVKLKARLIAKAFIQRPGKYFLETFAPVARKE